MLNEKPYVVVVGIDYSPCSRHALDEALRVASARTGELHVVHVEHDALFEALRQRGLETALEADAALDKVQKRVAERLDALAAEHGRLAVKRVVTHFRRGSPAEQIAQLAADVDADLVVVGSHGERGFERFLLGSVAERTNRLARCPVWTVRPKEHDARGRVPEIEPACPDCVSRRRETNGKEFWCARHSEHHIRAHALTYVSDPLYAPESTVYMETPQ
jgi:nucleotide-binding universal stress UspA family protein